MATRALAIAFLFGALAPLVAGCVAGAEGAEGASVDDVTAGPKLPFDEYTLLFTNPVCRPYPYGAGQRVVSNGGEPLAQKPVNVYCSSSDRDRSAWRESSPQRKLVEWIRDPETKEIFFTYLSFSNGTVAEELCKAIRRRSVKVTFVLDRKPDNDLTRARELLACEPGNGDPEARPRLELRGHDGEGDDAVGYAHNKLFIVNPRSDNPRFVFSSGNLSSGVVLHHENWHFVRVPAATHFARAHLCLMEGMLDHYRGKREFTDFVRGCREASGLREESDLRSFFVPGDGGRAGATIARGIREASFVGIAAHRFSFGLIKGELMKRFDAHEPFAARLVVDDDVWWAGKGEVVGPNTPEEYRQMVAPLAERGVDVRYMETNPGVESTPAKPLLHHNKFIVFRGPSGDAAFAGAGNFTGAAFYDNFENFYWITIPAVVEALRAQHEHLFELATPEERLPRENVQPPLP